MLVRLRRVHGLVSSQTIGLALSLPCRTSHLQLVLQHFLFIPSSLCDLLNFLALMPLGSYYLPTDIIAVGMSWVLGQAWVTEVSTYLHNSDLSWESDSKRRTIAWLGPTNRREAAPPTTNQSSTEWAASNHEQNGIKEHYQLKFYR